MRHVAAAGTSTTLEPPCSSGGALKVVVLVVVVCSNNLRLLMLGMDSRRRRHKITKYPGHLASFTTTPLLPCPTRIIVSDQNKYIDSSIEDPIQSGSLARLLTTLAGFRPPKAGEGVILGGDGGIPALRRLGMHQALVPRVLLMETPR